MNKSHYSSHRFMLQSNLKLLYCPLRNTEHNCSFSLLQMENCPVSVIVKAVKVILMQLLQWQMLMLLYKMTYASRWWWVVREVVVNLQVVNSALLVTLCKGSIVLISCMLKYDNLVTKEKTKEPGALPAQEVFGPYISRPRFPWRRWKNVN